MIRVIIILIAVFILLTALRNIIKRYKMISNSKPDSKSGVNKKNKDDNNIIDAKYEEIK